jgi:nucleotide-binding universal stress UspA family protein
MIKTILVPATGNQSDTTCFAAALPLTRAFAAHLDALHVRVDPVAVAVAMSTEGAGGMLLQGIIDDLTRDADECEARARSGFVDFCARENLPLDAARSDVRATPSAEWHVEIGHDARWMATYGMTADLLVASRGTPGDDAAARSILEALLLETGRPLLIPANGSAMSSIPERVAIAWKATPQAARAVAFALPFLSRAREVVVMTVEEEDGRRDDVDRLLSYFARHGIKAAPERLSPSNGGGAESLLAAASAKSDLLVMGGYGHTRLREWVFGGFTQQVLADAPLPVLIAH